MDEKKLLVENLTVSFKTNNGMVRAVRGVSFHLNEGETLAIVGESGSGKSVTSKAIMGILANNSVVDDGKIIYQGQNLLEIHEDDFHEIRGKKIGMIFQDPLSSLSPIMKIGKQITEGIILNGNRVKTEVYKRIQSTKIEVSELERRKAELSVDKKSKMDNSEEIAQINVQIKAKKTEYKRRYAEEKAKVKQEFDAEAEKIREGIQERIIEATQKIENAKEKHALEMAELNAKYTELQEKSKETTDQKDKLADLKLKIKKAGNQNKFELQQLQMELAAIKEKPKRVYKVTKLEAYEQAIKVMREVGIPEPERRFKQYPFQFSGGMRQRIVIAIALTMNPDVLICDEPTTALDVTIQAQILELISRLKEERNLSVIFITHDLGVVANVANRVAVMYAGKIVELGTSEDIFYNPKHPYTWALLGSMPDLESKEKLDAIPGTPPNMLYPPKGDAFAARNKYALKIDLEEQPPMFKVSETHSAATWLLHEDSPKLDVPKIITDRIERMKKLASSEVENVE